jgi:hypothetical protein
VQDPPEPEPSPVEVLREMQQGGETDEMEELFAEVEKRLRSIDSMLYDASAGRPLEGAEEAGIDRLLQRTRETSQQVLEGIDRILELALERAQEQQQQQQQGGGGQQQQQSQEGESPLDQQRSGAPSERERTPEGASQEREGETPDDPSQDPGGETPDGPQESGGDPRNRPGEPPPDGATGSVPPGGGNDRWGDLPVHVRELFRAQGGDDLPPRYRDWIDAYYRRLNERP